MLIKVQIYATACRHLFTATSLYMFRVSQHPSSGVRKTVSATSGVCHGNGTVTSFHRGLIRTVCIVLHRVGPLLTLNHDARNHVFKI